MTQPKTWTLGAAFLSGALLLASCGGGEAPQPEPKPEPTEQVGNVLGTIRPFEPSQARTIGPEEIKVSSSIDSTGKFGFVLPNVEAMTTTYGRDLFPVYDAQQQVGVFGLCSDVTTDAPAGLRLYPLNKLVTDTGLQLFANTNPANTELPLSLKVWWFANQDATVNFSGNCVLWGKINTQIAFKRGWNVLDVTLTGESATVKPGSQPDVNLVWTPFNSGAVGGLSLKVNLLEPWKAAPHFRR